MHCSWRGWLGLALVVLLAAAVFSGCGGDEEGNGAGAQDTEAADCTPAHEFSTVEEGKLIAVGPDAPPTFEVEAGVPSGPDVELIETIAANECLEAEFRIVPGATALEVVQSGRADIGLGGWYITDERGEVLGQTDGIFCDPTAVISNEGLDSLGELEGKRVGVVQGTLYVDELRQVLGADSVRLYQDAEAAFRDVEIGRIDAWVGGFGEGVLFKNANPDAEVEVAGMEPDERFSPSLQFGQSNLPHTKGNSDLTTALNDNLRELKDDGTLEELYGGVGLPLVGSDECP